MPEDVLQHSGETVELAKSTHDLVQAQHPLDPPADSREELQKSHVDASKKDKKPPVQAYVKDDRVIVIVGNVSEAMFVVQAQLAANKSYWKYQLEKADGTLHANGEWVAESKLVHG